MDDANDPETMQEATNRLADLIARLSTRLVREIVAIGRALIYKTHHS
jgi:hypothetical protein